MIFNRMEDSMNNLVANNLVAKHARKFNKAVVMRDRKKDYTRKGKNKFDDRKSR